MITAPPLPPKQRINLKQDYIPTNGIQQTVFVTSPPKVDILSISNTQVQGHENISSDSAPTAHVVKIKINPTKNQLNSEHKSNKSVIHLKSSVEQSDISENSGIKISIVPEMIQNNTQENFSNLKTERNNPYFFYSAFPPQNMVITSGQCSPSDTLDSGTCSDLDSTPPPLPKKKSVSVTVIGAQHKRTNSLGESDKNDSDIESNISCDSLNSSELNEISNVSTKSSSPILSINDVSKSSSPIFSENDVSTKSSSPILCITPSPVMNGKPIMSIEFQKFALGEFMETMVPHVPEGKNGERDLETKENGFSSSLLKDIQSLTLKLTKTEDVNVSNGFSEQTVEETKVHMQLQRSSSSLVDESTYEERQIEKQNELNKNSISVSNFYEADKFYKFHLNENIYEDAKPEVPKSEDELFAGYKDILSEQGATIKSAKGTVRGVKNRVRAGIATFLQINTTAKVSF